MEIELVQLSEGRNLPFQVDPEYQCCFHENEVDVLPYSFFLLLPGELHEYLIVNFLAHQQEEILALSATCRHFNSLLSPINSQL